MDSVNPDEGRGKQRKKSLCICPRRGSGKILEYSPLKAPKRKRTMPKNQLGRRVYRKKERDLVADSLVNPKD